MFKLKLSSRSASSVDMYIHVSIFPGSCYLVGLRGVLLMRCIRSECLMTSLRLLLWPIRDIIVWFAMSTLYPQLQICLGQRPQCKGVMFLSGDMSVKKISPKEWANCCDRSKAFVAKSEWMQICWYYFKLIRSRDCLEMDLGQLNWPLKRGWIYDILSWS